MSEEQDKVNNINKKIGIKYLVESSPGISQLIDELKSVTSISVTGIVNFVVSHENPVLVENILKRAFPIEKLFNETVKFDAVEVQNGRPGKGASVHYFDELIYGTYKIKKDKEGNPVADICETTGVIRRDENGFVTRTSLHKPINRGGAVDRIMIIKNMDYCLDFCKPEDPGKIDTRALFLLDKFRNPNTRFGCVLILVTNKKLDLPFNVSVIEINRVSDFEVKHLLNAYIYAYKNRGVKIIINDSDINQIIRKLSGLTYSEACDIIGSCFKKSIIKENDIEIVDMKESLRLIRTKINKDLMDGGFGLTQLNSRPWEDYICPEQSNFTHDIKKLMRDFKEVDILSKERKDIALDLKKKKGSSKIFNKGLSKIESLDKNIEDLRTRMPHVIVLYGQGGVGKCLGKGTKVQMFDGTKTNVEDIVEGDLLIGPDSKPRKVLRTTKGIGQLYEVTQKNGKNYICNGNHILSLKKGGKDNDCPVFISVNEYLKKRKTWKKTHYGWKSSVDFEKQDLPIDPYWIGLWLGDETSLKPVITVEEKSSLKDLKLLGNKHIPEIYKINSRKNRLNLLAGLIDSYGHKSKSGSLQFFNTNKKLAEDVSDLGRSLGFKVFETSSIKRLKSYNCETRCYTITFSGDLSEIPTKTSRKKAHDNTQKIGVKCGIDIKPIGCGEFFGFELNGDKQFLLEDYTVTHNSAFPIHLAGLLDMDVWDFNVNATHSKWIGQGSEQMRESLDRVIATSHVVIRIDEYDRAMGSTNERGGGMHEAHKQVESEFMNWLQNNQEENIFVKRNIFVILTTNHVENITGPMLRSGRTDLAIDIGSFDTGSMMEAFKTCSRRMHNRGVSVIGFKTPEDLQKEIDKLDIERLAELAMTKKFTVRDIEMLIIEMAAYKYYFEKYGDELGIPWTTESFSKVLENSEGSVKGASTGELKLGDRDFYKEDAEDIQVEFGDSITDVDKLKETVGFQEE